MQNNKLNKKQKRRKVKMINRYDHRGNRLSKFDAPLRLQYERGIKSFRKGKVKSPYPLNTMLHREWQRGFDFAYFVNLKRTKKYEARTRGKRVHG